MDNILEVRGLKMHFGGVKAVDELSFDVHRHELLGVIGPNGFWKDDYVQCADRRV